MVKQKVLFLVIISLIVAWGFRVVSEYDIHSEKIENPEYLKYVSEYQKSVEANIQTLHSDMRSELNLDYDISSQDLSVETCKNSNFEGADVKIKGVKFFNSYFGQMSEAGYEYDCNRVSLDPDHPYFGLPDITVAISPVEVFKPKDQVLSDFFAWMGNKGTEGPYQTYEKQLIITNDSTGETILRKFAMQLWLTKFKATVTVKATREKALTEFTKQELSNKLYPRHWYGSTDPGRLSVKDLSRKEEHKDNVYGNIQFVLEVNPNASPWYIKTENVQSSRPKIAVAGVYCQHFEKKSLEPQKVDFNTFAGKANPLYYFPFEKDSRKLDDGLSSNSQNFIERINEINENDIWDRPYYIRLQSTNIGSRRTGLGNINQQDDQVDIEFIMPLFVVGSLDVLMPSELLAEWSPPEPFKRKFTFSNLLPSWGVSGFGKVISGLILVVLVILVVNTVFPFLRFLI